MNPEQPSLFNDLRVVTVLPTSDGAFKQALTYFTTSNIAVGDVVSIPARTKTIVGIVTSVEQATERREELRQEAFALKKIKRRLGASPVTATYIMAANNCANYFATTTGQLLSVLIPKFVFDTKTLIDKTRAENAKPAMRTSLKPDQRVIQAPEDERMSVYKSLIRESFARKKSIFFCTPNIETAEELRPRLARGVEEYLYVFHSEIPKKQLVKAWVEAEEKVHPIVVIGTGMYLSLPRNDFDTIVLEREGENWKQIQRPYVDIKLFAEELTRLSGAMLVYGDSVLSLETMRRYQEHVVQELSPVRQRILSPKSESLVDMRKYDATRKRGGRETFPVISGELHAIIGRLKTDSERLILLANRKGLSPTSICGDCGTTLSCENCHVALVLHKDEGRGTMYVCHMCQSTSEAKRRCNYCGSWKLYEFGTGIERVEEIVRSHYPEHTVFVLSGDTATTRKRALDIRAEFMKTPGSILLGTEMLCTYLHEPVENTAVVSVDNIFSIPDFKNNERLFHLLATLKRLGTKQFLIQTRHAKEPVFTHALRGTILDFYREELALRKGLQYPPFSLLIKITREGTRATVGKDMLLLEELLGNWGVVTMEAFTPLVRGRYRMNGIIRLMPKNWPNETLLSLLRSLPPSYMVNVGPENLL